MATGRVARHDRPMARVLVVDDSSAIHAIYKLYLRSRAGLTVTTAKSGMEALQSIERDGEPALILLDINMPVMDGLETLAALEPLGTTKRVPIIVISTEGSEADVQRGLDAGARAYLRKPFERAQLLALVDQFLAQPAAEV